MKHFMILMVFATLMTGYSYAGEISTECPMMRETNERNNPKANMGQAKPKVKKSKSGATEQ